MNHWLLITGKRLIGTDDFSQRYHHTVYQRTTKYQHTRYNSQVWRFTLSSMEKVLNEERLHLSHLQRRPLFQADDYPYDFGKQSFVNDLCRKLSLEPNFMCGSFSRMKNISFMKVIPTYLVPIRELFRT
ncbi:hypothetical protein TNCT_626151 [Trichonephila clavata]|uniref:Uncharacterized protein n=1 Tax=Trichonephila clavata TaxID=2740835 RepID=A0A8X6GNY3_TRICU|nr:hypothetical protein TNCT_626151 [Trichonephila clavata]